MASDPKITIIAALADNNVIGNNGTLPWGENAYPEDLNRFYALSLGKPIIFGRATWKEFGGMFGHESREIIVTSQPLSEKSGFVESARSYKGAVKKAVRIARTIDCKIVYVAGGERIFAEAISDADVMELTHIHKSYDGDRWFPEINRLVWKIVATTPRNGFSFVRYERR